MDWIVAGNDQSLPAIGHDDMSPLSGDVVAQFLENANGVTLIDARNLWRNSNGDEFVGKLQTFGFSLAPDIFLGNLKPELNGFADVGECFIVGCSLTVTAWQRWAGDREAFLRFNDDNLILHE